MKVLCKALRRFPRPEADRAEKGPWVEVGEEVELNKTVADKYADNSLGDAKVKIADPEPAETRRAAAKKRGDQE